MGKTEVIKVRIDPDLKAKIEKVKDKALRDDNSDAIRFLIRLGYQYWEQRRPHEQAP